MLAVLKETETPQLSPKEYIEDLFNDYAGRFDTELVNNLGYGAPQHFYDAVHNELGDSMENLDILDLGCGTGLCGACFANATRHLTGVDLARKMLARAEERGIYTRLIQADVTQALAETGDQFDLILSGDVFIYIGRLEEIFNLVRARLKTGGLFALSIELDETGKDYTLRNTGRYAQSSDYIHRLANQSGMRVTSEKPVTIRYDNDKPIAGLVYLLKLS